MVGKLYMTLGIPFKKGKVVEVVSYEDYSVVYVYVDDLEMDGYTKH
jgi:hypothetical protein